jgi:hypothetical protein
MYRAMLVASVVLALFCGQIAPTQATTILFQDDFESQPSANVNNTDFDLYDVDALPIAPTGGTWTTSGATNRNLAVTKFTGPGRPAPFGQNYLRMFRDGSSAPDATAHFTQQSIVGDQIHIESQVWVEAATAFNAEIYGGDDTHLVFDLWTGSNGTIQSINGATGLSYAAATWNNWAVDYVIGDSNYTFSLNGNSVSMPVWQVGSLSYMDIHNGTSGSYYLSGFDNVLVSNVTIPEPSSIALLATGVIGLLAYAWRKRR